MVNLCRLENRPDASVSYQELRTLLSCAGQFSHLKSLQDLVALLNRIGDVVLPCGIGCIAIYNTLTKTMKSPVVFNNSTAKLIKNSNFLAQGNLPARELVSLWLEARHSIFRNYVSEVGDNSTVLNCQEFDSIQNIVLDGIPNDDGTNICFVYMINVDKARLSLYQICVEMLLPLVYEALCRLDRNEAASCQEISDLTQREKEVLLRMRNGLNNKKIAMQLNISVNTVKSHLYNIFQKLQARNRVEALRIAEKAGYLVAYEQARACYR